MVFCAGSCWCSYRDPIAYIAVPIAWAQIGFVTYCMVAKLIFPLYGTSFWSGVLFVLYFILLILIMWSYIQSMFSDPGVADRTILKSIDEKDEESETYNRCKKCGLIKPYRAHHCRKCQRCILKMDHHCPWISSCVGARNQKYFILFLLYVIICESYALVLSAIYMYRFAQQMRMYTRWIPYEYIFPMLSNWKKTLSVMHFFHMKYPIFGQDMYPYLPVVIQAIFSLVFVIFCIILLYQQMDNIRYDTTLVEKYVDEEGVRNVTFWDSLENTMGEPFCLQWFIPVEGNQMMKYIQTLCSEVSVREKTEFPLCYMKHT